MNSKILSAVLAVGLIAGVSSMASAEGMKKSDSMKKTDTMKKSDTMMKKDKHRTVTPSTTGSSGTSAPAAHPQTTPATPMGKGSTAETPKK